jgi:outer membrane biosynthesis protein TonB
MPLSVSPEFAANLTAAKLPSLALALGLMGGLVAATPTLAQAPASAVEATQNPAAANAPAQPAQSQQAPSQPATAPNTPQQSPATAAPDATQTQAPASTAQPKPADAPATYNTTTTVVPPSGKPATPSGPAPSASDAILEAELRTLLVGKPLFLRGCYLSDDLRFNERGGLYDASPRGSFTLSGIQIESLRLTRKELILEGDRYGYRFLGALPDNNPTDDMERIKITPKKKVLRIRIEREEVEAPRKEKEKPAKPQTGQPATATAADGAAAPGTAATPNAAPVPDAAATTQPSGNTATTDTGNAEPLKDEPVTDSPEHAVQRLKETLARLFTPSLDDRFVGSMPPFWQLYYKRLAAKTEYHPSDPSVLRQSQVDKKARLITAVDPPSNELAQEFGVAGIASYHVVVGPDGKPGEIAVAQPIGFGLDENAVETLKRATFEPAIKDGKPVPVVLDLIVQFHIYSKLTSRTSKPDQEAKPSLPGPYSLPPKP